MNYEGDQAATVSLPQEQLVLKRLGVVLLEHGYRILLHRIFVWKANQIFVLTSHCSCLNVWRLYKWHMLQLIVTCLLIQLTHLKTYHMAFYIVS